MFLHSSFFIKNDQFIRECALLCFCRGNDVKLKFVQKYVPYSTVLISAVMIFCCMSVKIAIVKMCEKELNRFLKCMIVIISLSNNLPNQC